MTTTGKLPLRRQYGITWVFGYLAFITPPAALLLATTVSADPPIAPSDLRVVADTGGLELFWKDNSQNELGFEINNGESSRTVGAQTTYYRWGNMKPSGQYMCLTVRAYNNEGTSSWEPNVDPWYRCGITEGSLPRVGALHTANYAGYGARGAEFLSVSGAWWVPRIECPFQLGKKTRVAPWVGLAGNDLQSSSTWLVQVGTVSICRSGVVYYKAVWEALNKPGVGMEPKELFDVKENDLIVATVSYDSNTGWFNIAITNRSQGKSVNEPVEIKGATVANSRYRALCIVESETESLGFGLAQFNTPIEWFGCARSSVSGASTVLERFDMDKPQRKALVSPLGRNRGAFTVTWRHE